MEGEGVAVVESKRTCIVEIKLGILRIGYAQHVVAALGIAMEFSRRGYAVEEIARRLCAHLYLITACARDISHGTAALLRVIDEIVGHVHDEQVLVAVAQDGIMRVIAFKVFLAKLVRNPWHEDVVHIDEVEAVARAGMFGVLPLVSPTSREQTAVELRTVLRVVEQRQDGRCLELLLLLVRNAGESESGKLQTNLAAVFNVVLARVALEAADGFVGTTEFDREEFRTMHEVAT